MATRAIGLVGLLALAGLLGCGPISSPGAGSPQDSPHAASPATAPSDRATVTVTLPPEPPGIRLSFIQQRFDEGTRRADITVMNYSGHPMRVRAVGLDWPGYPGPAQLRPYLVPDQFTVDLRYRLPVPSCDPDVFDTHPVGVAVTRSRTVRRPIDAEGMRFLRRIWQMSCDQLLLRRTVRLEYDGPWRLGPDGVLAGRLRLLRIGGHAGADPAVTLTEIQGSPVFDLALGRPRTLAAGVRSVDVPLLVRSGSRCDAHSRGQVTTPFTFRVWARIGGRSVTVIAMPAERTKVRMLAFLDRMCAQ